MRQILVPNPVKLKLPMIDNDGKNKFKEEPFQEFLLDNVLSKMGTKLKDTHRNLRIYQKFENAKPGDLVAIDTSDWERMNEELEKGDWNQYVAMQCISFFEAIQNAVEVEIPKE